ncbi:unnamed protein product [Parajaminaea phylloscopi]
MVLRTATCVALLALSSAFAYELSLNGQKLPSDFVYGCGTSAYQTEGAYNADGKGESIWDVFVRQKDVIKNGDTGQDAMDFYHTYSRDLPLFHHATGVNTFDHTIAWTRILPQGTGNTPNAKGVEFYRNVANTAHQNKMSFSATLYHWDLPQALQKKYNGWLSEEVLDDFENYARVTMTALGDVVDRWISINEPRTFCTEGYYTDGSSAPGLKGNLTTVYRCFHNALLAHARAHKVFQELKSKNKVRGTFGIKIDGGPAKPYDPKSQKDRDAAARDLDFAALGWALGPLTTGEYPKVMRDTMGDLLPRFSKEEAALVKDSYDVIWFDVYTSVYAKHVDKCPKYKDPWPICVNETTDRNGVPIGKPTGSDWNFLVTDTIRDVLNYAHYRWKVKAFAIGETGMAVRNGYKQNFQQKLNDRDRVEWFRVQLAQVSDILKEGKLPLKGFVFWSCMSNFEWSNGYQGDFGVIYTKHGKNQQRSVKNSAKYLNDVFRHGLHSDSRHWG